MNFIFRSFDIAMTLKGASPTNFDDASNILIWRYFEEACREIDSSDLAYFVDEVVNRVSYRLATMNWSHFMTGYRTVKCTESVRGHEVKLSGRISPHGHNLVIDITAKKEGYRYQSNAP